MKKPLAALALALAACATGPRGPGAFESSLAASAQLPSARKVEIEMAGDGSFTKVAVEHADPAAAPEALRKQAESTWPGSTPTEFETEVYSDGRRVNELEVKTADGKECELSEAGYTECKLAPAELPAPVSAAIASAAPGPEISEAEVRKSAGGEEYRVEVKSGGRKWYLRLKPDGTIVGKMVMLDAEVVVPAK